MIIFVISMIIRWAANLSKTLRSALNNSHQGVVDKRAKMEITNKNFTDKLTLIEKAIASADFIAIDGEFTGLSNNEAGRNAAMDTPAERYDKVRESANKFLLVQFGLCTFHYNAKKDKYTNRAFNFYVWPKPYSRSAPDPRFVCQTSSIDFLINQDFDFNKLFKEGVTYLRPCDEAKIREAIKERQTNRRNSSNFATPTACSTNVSFIVPDEHKDFVEETITKVETWLGSDKAKEKLELDSCNAFQRRLLYNTVKPRLSGGPQSFHMETILKGKDRCIVLTKADEVEQKKKEEDRDRSEFDDLDDAVGFSKVIRKITESGKPVVGHNMLLDLCHTVQQFVAPLPEDYNDFKSLVKSALPKILDTKLLAKTSPLKEDIPHSSLEELIKTLSLSPFKMPQVEIESDQMGYELGDNAVEKYHEAGYDAFVTGVCFIAMRDRLRVLSTADPKTDVTAPFMNKVNLMRILDIPYLNLAGEDVVPNRDHVFYVTFPPEWKTTDLLQLFSPFGSVHITWLSDTTAYVGLREFVANSKSVVISTLNCSSMYSIVPYGLHKKLEAMYEMQNTGITPIMEKTTIFNQNKWPTSKLDQAKKHPPQQTTESKKRSASPEKEAFKRSKSVSEDTNKMFEEPPWE